MSRFYLNVRNGEVLTRDPQPYFFSTAQVARDSAAQAVRELLNTHVASEDIEQQRIEIADETGHPIAVVDMLDVQPAHQRVVYSPNCQERTKSGDIHG